MNREELQALGRVLEYGHDEVKNYEEGGKPPGHIAEDLLALDQYREARALETDDERKGRAPAPSEASVVDRGSREIGQRWAKEAIGMAAVELNEAYSEFVTTRDEDVVPSGKLFKASRRLEEAMQHLGLTDDLPF